MSDTEEKEVYLTAQDAIDELGQSKGLFYKYVKRGLIDRVKEPGMEARYPKSQCQIDAIMARRHAMQEKAK